MWLTSERTGHMKYMWSETMELCCALVLGVRSFTFETEFKLWGRENASKPLARLIYVTGGEEDELGEEGCCNSPGFFCVTKLSAKHQE